MFKRSLVLLSLVSSSTAIAKPQLEYIHPILELDSSIRAISAVSETLAWFAGSNGHYGYTQDGGRSWQVSTMPGDQPPHFRGVAVTPKAVVLMEITEPARLHRSTDNGNTWNIVYEGASTDTFFDAIKIDQSGVGYVFGDPQDGCITVLKTQDHGANWQRIACSSLPSAAEGEGGFAASNTNIDMLGDQVWIATGGQVARIYHSTDAGLSWRASETPMVQGQSMTGIFSIDISDFANGYAVGGNWEDKADNSASKIQLHNNQNHWLVSSPDEGPGYRSCVQFFPHSMEQLISVGSEGVDFSNNRGEHWYSLGNDSWYAASIAPDGTLFLAGPNKLGVAQIDES